jgi:hypothetical protein
MIVAELSSAPLHYVEAESVSPALQLLPGERISAMTDRNSVLWFAIGVPAGHIG